MVTDLTFITTVQVLAARVRELEAEFEKRKHFSETTTAVATVSKPTVVETAVTPVTSEPEPSVSFAIQLPKSKRTLNRGDDISVKTANGTELVTFIRAHPDHVVLVDGFGAVSKLGLADFYARVLE